MEHDVDELELIRAAVAGDERAFEGVVRHYSTRLRWLIRLRLDRALQRRISADDVFQEAMLVVAKRIQLLEVTTEAAFWTWLCRVVEHRLIDLRRRHLQAKARDMHREMHAAPADGNTSGFRLENMLTGTQTSPSGRIQRAEQRDALELALGTLPESFRVVIVLRMLEGLSVSDTAAIMERSPGAVSVLLTKAIRRLGAAAARNDSADLEK